MSLFSSVALAHLVDNLPVGAGMEAYRPVYASTVCWINGRAGLALLFFVPASAVPALLLIQQMVLA